MARTQLMFHYEDPDFADYFTDDEIKKIEELIEVEYNSEKQYKEYKRILRILSNIEYMVKIGILGGRLGETNPSSPYRKWMDNVPEKYIDNDGWILNEASLVAAIEYQYPDAEVKYLTNFNEKTLQKIDVNFLVGVNL